MKMRKSDHNELVLFHAARCSLGKNITQERVDKFFKASETFLKDINVSDKTIKAVKKKILEECSDYGIRFKKDKRVKNISTFPVDIQFLIIDMLKMTNGNFHYFSPAYIRGFGPISEWLTKLKVLAIMLEDDCHCPTIMPFKNDYVTREALENYIQYHNIQPIDNPRLLYYYDMDHLLSTGFYGTDPNSLIIPEKFSPIKLLPAIKRGVFNYDRYC